MPRPFALIGLTVFFVLAVLYNAPSLTVLIVFLSAVTALLLSVIIRNIRRQPAIPVALAGTAVACLMLILMNEFYYYPQLKLAGSTHDAKIVVTDFPEYNYGKYYYEAKAVEADGEKCSVKLRLMFTGKQDIAPYDEINGNFYFYKLGASSDEMTASYKSENTFIGAKSDTGEFIINKTDSFSIGREIANLRNNIGSSITCVLPGDPGALSKALVLGDRSDLSREAYNWLKNCGITHVICVSGLHISLWSLALLWILRKIKLKETTACIIMIPAEIFFMLLTGMTYSVVRAGIMMIIYLLSVILSRRHDSLNALGVSICLITAVNPFSAGSVSLQLSVLATLGIILCSEYVLPLISKITDKHHGFIYVEKPVKMLLITASAAMFTAPVSLSVYGSFNFSVFPSNLIIVGLAEVCMICAAVGAVIAMISTSILNIPAFIAGVIAKCILKIASFISESGLSEIRVSEKDAYIILCVIFAAAALFALVEYSGKRILAPASVALCLIFVLSVCGFSYADKQRTRITVTDIGRGLTAVISYKNKTILFGCSGDDYDGGYKISQAMNLSSGKIDAFILPGEENFNPDYYDMVMSSFTSEKLFSSSEDYSVRAKLSNGKSEKIKDKYNSGNIEISVCHDSSDREAYIVKTDEIKALFLPLYGVEISSLDKETKDCDVVVCNGKYPDEFFFDNMGMIVISDDEKHGCEYQNQLISKGINCCATAGNGDISIYGFNGKINVERG